MIEMVDSYVASHRWVALRATTPARCRGTGGGSNKQAEKPFQRGRSRADTPLNACEKTDSAGSRRQQVTAVAAIAGPLEAAHESEIVRGQGVRARVAA